MQEKKVDPTWMRTALEQAREAAKLEEVPVGAVLVQQEEIISIAHNRREIDANPLGHAEILTIQEAAAKLGRWRLHDCTLIVTLEPCPMCAGAIINARIKRVIFGAKDPRTGCAGSMMNLLQNPKLNHRVDVIGGVMGDESSQLLKQFFSQRRKS